ncbi:rod shape-determining protein RodA [Defluviitalea phaphyphila]|uniref:rod shape-determining protein RodA n=1 Tax=Defluviitalea phaphyphila TaxID=1473580 RepID=UPI0007308F61|nr:rod shape-determining protein RodA [Defluviitalea phaphyphila]
MISKQQLKFFDILIVFLVTVLVIIGLIAISSAQHVNSGADPIYVRKQIIWFIIGFILMLITAFIDYNTLGELYIIAYVVSLGLLIAVIFFGDDAKGAVRWLNIGPIRIQPSEFSKISIILFMSKLIDKKKEKINKFSTLILLVIFLGLPVFMILKQPDLSTSLVFIVIFLVLLYIGGISYKYIFGSFIIGVPLIMLLFIYIQNPNQKLLKDYQRERIMAMIYKEEAEYSDDYFQTQQSIHAIGSGQLYGKGLYKGTLNQLSYLPEPHTDFIFSVIGEEFGFIGCISIISLIFLLILKSLWIARYSKDLFGKLLIVGVVTMIAFQTFVNIGVVTGLLPNTGIPLPFISFGGSSLWTNMIGIGLILNVGMRRQKLFFRR